jgi:hypothetical protein
MEHELQLADRLEQAAALLERALAWLEERQSAVRGEVERISATVDQSRREEELAEKLAAAEREIAELKAAAATSIQGAASQPQLAPPQMAGPQPPAALNPLRRTVPASTTAMLAKHGIGDGPVEVRTLDAALAGLSLEQRIAVKSQLLRAGALS